MFMDILRFLSTADVIDLISSTRARVPFPIPLLTTDSHLPVWCKAAPLSHFAPLSHAGEHAGFFRGWLPFGFIL